jgi:hypothetical protein
MTIANTSYAITNNIISGNGTGGPGVTIDGKSSGKFEFNTVTKNLTANGIGGIDCGSGALHSLDNSIVWGNTALKGTQFAGASCTFNKLVAGMDAASGVIGKDPAFVDPMRGDFHLVPGDAANAACCIDQVPLPLADGVDHDVDGSKRPKGASWDIGAHEAK